MDPLVLSQVELDCRTEAALVTLVRLLSGVDPFVLGKVSLTYSAEVALVALMWFVS